MILRKGRDVPLCTVRTDPHSGPPHMYGRRTQPVYYVSVEIRQPDVTDVDPEQYNGHEDENR